MLAGNVPATLEAHYGVPMLGAVLNAMNFRLDAGTVAFCIAHGEARVFIVDRELVSDVWDLADMHIDEIGRLFEASGAEWVQPPQPAHPRRGRMRHNEPDGIC